MTADVAVAAETLVRAGDIAAAEALLLDAADKGALSPEAGAMLARLLHNRAVTLWAAGETAGAEALLHRALALDPTLEASRQALRAASLGRAAAAMDTGDLAGAAAAADQVVALGVPADGCGPAAVALAVRLHLASVDRAGVQPVLATRLALAAWVLHPAGDAHYATARSLFVHLGTGELGRAVPAAEFEAHIQVRADDLVALIGLANVERRAARLHRAEHLYRLAALRAPWQPFAAGRLAAVLAELGRFAEADRLFQAIGAEWGGVESVIRLDPAFIAALPRRGAAAPEVVPVDADLVVFAGCDSGYFRRFSDAFLNSLVMAGTRAAVHFHIVNPDRAALDHLARLRRRHPGLTILDSSESVPATIAPDGRRTFYACARFLQLPTLLRRYGRPLLMLDIDMVVLRDVMPLAAQLSGEDADLALSHGRPHDPWCRLWADAILCAPTDAAVAAFDAVRAYIRHYLEGGAAVWFLDQVALYAVLGAGYGRHLAANVLPWPVDIQNGDTASCYFWSLHCSQPSNQHSEHSDFYRRFAGGDEA